ncbi:MAG: hypothetical protein L6Q99_02645 [Planctomycetes bacterium]|nr:hypothetical protein [Planctomycetota bacterium]
MLSVLIRVLAFASLVLALPSCATAPNAAGPDDSGGKVDDEREFLDFADSQFAALYAAGSWNGAAARAEELTRKYNPVVTPSEATNAWKMFEACELVRKLDVAAVLLIELLDDFDAPRELWRFAKTYGVEVLERNGASRYPRIDVFMRMGRHCEAGEWVAARALMETEYSDTQLGPHPHRILAQVYLGDLLRDAGRFEPALAEYTAAAYAESLHDGPDDPGAKSVATVLSVRIENLLYEMGEPAWALDAMKNINANYALLEPHAAAKRVDQSVRDRINADVRHVQSGDLHGRSLEDLATLDLRAALSAVDGLTVVERNGETVRFASEELGLSIQVADDVIEVDSTKPEHGVGRFTSTWDVELKPTLMYVQWSSKPPAPPRCLRTFNDGSVFIGTTGFESHGVLLRRGVKPYVGAGRFGRHPDDSLRVRQFFERATIPGKPVEGLGERQSFAVRTADEFVLLGEGYVDGDRLVPDGPVRLTYGPNDWYAGFYSLGVAGPWRRCGDVLTKSDMDAITDLAGNLVPWMSPEDWALSMDRMREDRLAEQRRLDEQRVAEQIAYDEMQKAYWEAIRGERELRGNDGSAPPLRTCYMCEGVGMVYKGGGSESYSSWITDNAGVSHYVTSTRWVSSQRVTCDYCGGAGER